MPIRSRIIQILCPIGLLFATATWCVGEPTQPPPAGSVVETGGFEQHLLARIARRPDDASNWRMLGRFRLRTGDASGALDACERATLLEPQNASAHFDLAHAYLATRQPERAIQHFEQVQQIAPTSDYARDASRLLQDLGARSAAITSDLEPNRFGGRPLADIPLEADEPRRWSSGLDFGVQYNTNVQLAPVSRVVVSPGLESFQWFVGPQVGYKLLVGELWRSGVGFDGYFNLNESTFEQFNVQDYRPKIFLERSFMGASVERIARFQYDFTLDEFNGSTFGRRHAATWSLSSLGDASESVIYWVIDYANFANDGVDPAITSLDGWTNTLGLSHQRYLDDLPWLSSVRGGVDLQWAPLEGSDYAYQGVFVYGETQTDLAWRSRLVLQLGWGNRDYPDFTGAPSRNENIWRGSVELRKAIRDGWELTAFTTYDRFATDNVDFDTDRYVTGLMTSYRR